MQLKQQPLNPFYFLTLFVSECLANCRRLGFVNLVKLAKFTYVIIGEKKINLWEK